MLAAKSEIRTGEMVNLDLKLDEPKVPSFGRMQFEHEILPNSSGTGFDDTYKLNTQSGTQWDGFRHVCFEPFPLPFLFFPFFS